MKGLKVIVLIFGLFLCVIAFGRIEAVKAPIKYQPVTLQSATNMIRFVATEAVCRAIQTAPIEYTDVVAGYFRQIGRVFCNMETTGDFTHSGLVSELEKIPSPLVTDTYGLDVKILLLALYKVVYGDRLRAEIPPARWLSESSQAFCEAIGQGLKDAGRTGVN